MEGKVVQVTKENVNALYNDVNGNIYFKMEGEGEVPADGGSR